MSRIRDIRRAKNISGTKVAEYLNISPQYYYDIEKGEKRLSAENAIALARYFGVTVDYLLDGTDGNGAEIPLTPKEEKDIAKDLERMLSNLESKDGLAFMGEPMDDETKELMRISLENSMRLAKQLAKKKFTPKKYR